MGRLERFNIPGATYHVMNRGNHKETIFLDPRDRRRFLRIWTEQQEVFGVLTLGGCLIDNHFHEIVNTPHGNLSEFMQQVDGQFARWSNWRHGRVGHLFQGRFRDVRIEHDVHLLTALCYVFMNPVAANLCAAPEDYRWSTYASTTGLAPVPPYLTLDWLKALFPQATLEEAQQELRHLMNKPRPVAAYLDDDLLNVDAESIRQVIRSYTGEQVQYASLPHLYRTALRPGLDELRRDSSASREEFVYEARVVYGYKNVEIAKVLAVNPATVSKIFRTHQRLGHAA